MSDAAIDLLLFEVNRTVDKQEYLPVLQFARHAERIAYHRGAPFRVMASAFVVGAVLASFACACSNREHV
jgi:hypothetical protein